MEHRMNLQNSPFSAMKAGTKTIEMRLYDEKRKLIRTGDVIVFTNAETAEDLRVTVLELRVFRNFEELYRHYGKTELGYAEAEIPDPADMYLYYPKEKTERYGALAIRIQKI